MKNATHLTGLLLLVLTIHSGFGGSATWSANPVDTNWWANRNWTTGTVPNGPSDIATFDISNITAVSIKALGIWGVEVNSMVFNPGASAFTISCSETSLAVTVLLSGAGVINNSGIIQHFDIHPPVSQGGNPPHVFYFSNNATAGDLTEYTVYGHAIDGRAGGMISFFDTSTAGSSVITNFPGDGSYDGNTNFYGSSSAGNATITNEVSTEFRFGALYFYDSSNAGTATIINNGGRLADETGHGRTTFESFASAANSTIICNGASADGAGSGVLTFSETSSAGNATLVINGGSGGGEGGNLSFGSDSSGGTARLELFGNATLNIGAHNPPRVTVGSIEGDGSVLLDANNLTTGSNNLSTTFGGVIQDLGSLSKIGTGNLTLTGANTYTGGTIVSGGILLANNTKGSGTGSGPVQVTAGTFGGGGKTSGAVSVGTGSGPGAFLGPGATGVIPGTLTIRKKLTLMADGTYKVTMNSSSVTADKVSAKGVKIRGAQILLDDRATSVLPTGTTFTVINNTAATPISGVFANLADGGTVTVGNNAFQANYEGGDGNDLTLTVLH
jgi:autotransporter-associated beta strand protein